MASTKVDPAHGQEVAEAEDDDSVFTDSEEEEGELHIGRRDVASDDEGEAEEGEICGDPAAADMQARLAKVKLGDDSDGAVSVQPRDPVHGDSDGYESEVEEDAADVPAKDIFQEQRAERKKPEPYDVPTSGAFWMHDDRMDDEEFAASGQAAQQRPKKKLFDPEAGDDAWKHDRFELLDLPPEEDDYRGFLEAGDEDGDGGAAGPVRAGKGFLEGGQRGRGRRGRGGRGRGMQGVNPPPGYENGTAGPSAADSRAQYDDKDGTYGRQPAYAEQFSAERHNGRGRGRGGSGHGQARSAVPISGQPGDGGYLLEGRGSRGGKGRRGGRGAAYGNGYSADVNSSGRGRGRSQSSRSRQQGGGSLLPEEWPSLPTPGQSSQGTTQLNVGARDYTPGQGSSKPSGRDSGRSLQPSAAPFAPPASALPDPQAFIPGPLQASEGGALQPPVRRPVSIQAPADGSQAVAAGTGGRGRGSRRYTAAGGGTVS